MRSKTVEYLTQILNECPDDQFTSAWRAAALPYAHRELLCAGIFVYEKRLASLIKKNMGDPDKTVRASTRQLFLAFANVWPTLAHK